MINSFNPTLDQFIRIDTHRRALSEAIYKAAGRKYRLGIFKGEQKKETTGTKKDPLDDFMKKYGPEGTEPHRLFLATTKGGHYYTEFSYQDEDMFLFGRETKGLPRDFIADHADHAIRIPMSSSTRLRSFNLANSANIILFEALRQLGFPGLE